MKVKAVVFWFIAILGAALIIGAAEGVFVDTDYKFPNNPYFQHLDANSLFKNQGETADSVVLERVAAQGNKEVGAYRAKINKIGRDSLLSKIFPIETGNTSIFVNPDSLKGTPRAKISLGLYRGIGFGDSLGFEYRILRNFSTAGSLDTFRVTLVDSAWFAEQASPYGIIKIEETDSTIIGWFINIIAYRGRGK